MKQESLIPTKHYQISLIKESIEIISTGNKAINDNLSFNIPEIW